MELTNNHSYRKELRKNNNEKLKKRSLLNEINTYTKEYCDYTGIHGFKYLGEKRSNFEKICWTIIFISSLTCCLAVIYKSYMKWMYSPVIVNLASEETNIYEIPFPAVTICQEVKVSKDHFNYSNTLMKLVKNITLTPEELRNLQFMSLLCDSGKIHQNEIPEINITNEEDFFSFLQKGRSNFLEKCSWMGKKVQCEKVFQQTLTDEGVCMTFNMLNKDEIFHDLVVQPPLIHPKDRYQFSRSDNWSIEYGYSHHAGVHIYPRRAELSGSSNSLIVNLNINMNDLDYACTSFSGFQVVLHLPVRFPTVQEHYFRVPLGKSVIVAITPTQVLTSEDVQDYSGERKKCWSQNEAKLKYFRNYTKFNCNLECRADYVKKACGCVGYFMPRVNNTPLCGNAKKKCMKKVKDHLEMWDLVQSLRSEEKGDNFNERMKCHCLPMCTFIEYNTEITEIEYDWYKEYEAVGENISAPEGYARSQLTLYFKTSYFIPYERNELYGNVSFMANVGGLLGLFIGFSILSLFEIIYFLSIRIMCNLKLYQKWYGLYKE